MDQVRDGQRRTVAAGSEAGAAYVVADAPAEPDVGALLARIAELEAEIAQLRDGLASRQQIGLVTGLLAERLGLTPARAWALVVRLSSHTNTKAREVARILEAGYFDRLDPDDFPVAARLNEQLPENSRIDLSPERLVADAGPVG